jgi:hypothetical protein
MRRHGRVTLLPARFYQRAGLTLSHYDARAPIWWWRAPVTTSLRTQYRGETVMASIGSLGHYMHDLSAIGLTLRDFLHEGNGDVWLAALDGARPFAGLVLIEERAEGGDMLAFRARESPRLLRGSRVSRLMGGWRCIAASRSKRPLLSLRLPVPRRRQPRVESTLRT